MVEYMPTYKEFPEFPDKATVACRAMLDIEEYLNKGDCCFKYVKKFLEILGADLQGLREMNETSEYYCPETFRLLRVFGIQEELMKDGFDSLERVLTEIHGRLSNIKDQPKGRLKELSGICVELSKEYLCYESYKN